MSTKLSIDLTDSNKQKLEKIKADRYIPYGNTINTLIQTFCNLPEDVQDSLYTFCKEKMALLSREMNTAGDFAFEKLSNKYVIYGDIASFFSKGYKLRMEDVKRTPIMKKIKIKNGYLICPDDWKLINPEDAEKCDFAYVIECRNSAKYGIPHYVYFTFADDRADGDLINRRCVSVYPEFKEVLDKQVNPVYDPNDPSKCLNIEEHLASPYIGHFPIHRDGIDYLIADKEPPYGAKIVYTKGEM